MLKNAILLFYFVLKLAIYSPKIWKCYPVCFIYNFDITPQYCEGCVSNTSLYNFDIIKDSHDFRTFIVSQIKSLVFFVCIYICVVQLYPEWTIETRLVIPNSVSFNHPKNHISFVFLAVEYKRSSNHTGKPSEGATSYPSRERYSKITL